jgi:hypothetical protein
VGVVCTFWHDTDNTADGGFEGVAALGGQELAANNTDGPPYGQLLSLTGVGDTEAPGYVSRCQVLNPTFTVRAIADSNDADTVARAATYTFVVFVDFSSQLDVSFGGAAVFFRRLITPENESVQTFDDVPPDHIFHQYIEALAASSITVGCQTSPPLYCPDAPLTRGQMAVFIARTVGLWWLF